MATNEIPNFRDLEREIGLTEIFNPADCGGTTEIEELKQQIWNLKDRVKNLENLAEIGSSKKTDPSKFISKAHMLQMIQDAISQGSENFGVSRTFIRKILNEQYDVPMTSYYQKKLSFILQTATKDGVIKLDSAHQLYKLV